MATDIIYVDEKSEIPLYGVDFIGAIDRGTNVIELKPLTLCNLKCKYCFVSAGDYDTNFIVDPNYLLKKIRDIIEIKGYYKIEIHFAPYGEILLYPKLFHLIKELWKIDGIEIISMQTNGLLLNEEIIKQFGQQFNVEIVQVGKLGKLTFTYLDTKDILGYYIEILEF